MRVLIAIQPGTGHFNPIAPLARSLVSKGHDVAFATSQSFCSGIRDKGFQAFDAGIDFLEERFSEAFPELAEMPLEAQALYILKTIWLDRAAKAMLPDLDRLINEWSPDILLHDYWEFASPLIARRKGLPHAVIAMSPHMPPQLLTMLLHSQFEELIDGLGLEPDPDLKHFYKYLYLDLYPPLLQEVSPDSLGVARHFRPWDMEHNQVPPPWMAESSERPLVYVSMGTVFNEAPEIFEHILQGLEHEEVEVVLSLGSETSNLKLASVPNARIESFVPQRAILDRASVFITHAGFNSLLKGFSAAVPMLCIPLSAEQPFNAANAERVGAATVLSRQTASPEAIRDGVRRLLQDPSFKQNSQRVKTELASLPAVDEAVSVIEYVADTGNPIGN